MVNAQHSKLMNVELKVGAVESFREDVGELVFRADGKKTEEFILKPFTNHMTVDVDKFHSLVELSVLSDMSS